MSGCHITPNLGLSHGSHRPFTSETRTESVLQSTGGLASTRKGARIRYQGGKRTVIDGPFTESKGLIAGYAILDLPSRAAAVDWAMCFGDVVKVNEIDVRQMPEW